MEKILKKIENAKPISRKILDKAQYVIEKEMDLFNYECLAKENHSLHVFQKIWIK